ncbi:hypothetical protein [uncultured Treponema sp.]|uniref:hypothetical protein n=1 Tax=uncultured Treponema sp. TaxID=162155 RepID=UPI0025918B72|nr:hypothetical protein [uncultured Treponema sp.]
MKKLAKIMAVFAAIMMALAFAGCNNDDDDDPSKVAVFKATDEYDGATYTLSCYDDNTFVIDGKMGDLKCTVMTGTYTGNPSKDGTITVSLTKFIDFETGKLVDASEEVKANADGDYTITNGKMEINRLIFTRQ